MSNKSPKQLTEMQHRALQVAELYDNYNKQSGRQVWEFKDYVSGLVGDVGDLVKLTMALENRRAIDDVQTKVEHELNDILWSVLLLFYFYRIDIEPSFNRNMEELEVRIKKMINEHQG